MWPNQRSPRSVRLNLEQLEDRCCPTVFPGDTITVSVFVSAPNDTMEVTEDDVITVKLNSTGSYQNSFNVPVFSTLQGGPAAKIVSFQATTPGEQVFYKATGNDPDDVVNVTVTVNGKPALSGNDKVSLNNTGSSVIYGGIGVGVLGLVGTIINPTAAIVTRIAAGLGILGGVIGGVGTRMQSTASNDPPDPNFRNIPTPRPPHVPQFRGVPRAFNALLKNEAQIIGLLNAIATCTNRASGAEQANQPRFEARQLRAAAKYRSQLAQLLVKDVGLRLVVSAELTAAGVLPATITAAQAMQFRQSVMSNGLPPAMLATLQSLGTEPQSITNITQMAAGVSTTDLMNVCRDPIANPVIIQSLLETAGELSQPV